jgi:hypothetical protein
MVELTKNRRERRNEPAHIANAGAQPQLSSWGTTLTYSVLLRNFGGISIQMVPWIKNLGEPVPPVPMVVAPMPERVGPGRFFFLKIFYTLTSGRNLSHLLCDSSTVVGLFIAHSCRLIGYIASCSATPISASAEALLQKWFANFGVIRSLTAANKKATLQCKLDGANCLVDLYSRL